MKIRFLITNAYGGSGGTIRTTINNASALAVHHDVEIISVVRRRHHPRFETSDRVEFRGLVDARDSRKPDQRTTRSELGTVARRWASRAPSVMIHPQDARYGKFSLETDWQLYRFLRSVRDGVLIGTRPGLNLAIARFARSEVVRVGQEHVFLDRHRPRLRRSIRRAYPRLDLVCALTRADRSSYEQLLGDATRVECIPNGVPEAGTAPRASLENPVVMGMGRLTPFKGFDRLVDAFAQVSDRHPPWSLRIFGRGDMQTDLQQQIDRLGMGRVIRLMGHTPRALAELSDASVFVLPSHFEGFSMVLLEAMACGLPVVSFDCPTGPRELIDSGHNGLLVRNGNIEGMAAAIERLMVDGELRRRLGAAAIETAMRYDSAHVAAQWEEVLSELVVTRGDSHSA